MKKAFLFVLALFLATSARATLTGVTHTVTSSSITLSWTSGPTEYNDFANFSQDGSTCALTQTTKITTDCLTSHSITISSLASGTTYCVVVGGFFCSNQSKDFSATMQIATNGSDTATPTPTWTKTWTRTATQTATVTLSGTPTLSFTITKTFTTSPTPTLSFTITKTATQTASPTTSPTPSITKTPTPTPSITTTVTPTAVPTTFKASVRQVSETFFVPSSSFQSMSGVASVTLSHTVSYISTASAAYTSSSTTKFGTLPPLPFTFFDTVKVNGLLGLSNSLYMSSLGGTNLGIINLGLSIDASTNVTITANYLTPDL